MHAIWKLDSQKPSPKSQQRHNRNKQIQKGPNSQLQKADKCVQRQEAEAHAVWAHRNYYAEVWVRHADWKEAEFFHELPAHLRGEVAVYLMEDVFEQSDFFR